MKRKRLADFAWLIAGKVEVRYAAGDLDAARYQKIAPRFAALNQGSSSNFAGDATTKPG